MTNSPLPRRDQFAMAAMQTILSTDALTEGKNWKQLSVIIPGFVDLLLAELDKPSSPSS